MNTSLDHLPSLKRQQLLSMAKIIVGLVKPEKIILFGDYTSGGWGADFYTDKQLPGNYDVLVITRKDERRSEYEIQDQVENRCRFQTPVSVLVHDIDYVNRQLKEGKYFFTMIRREAILLYDAGFIPLAEARPLDLPAIRNTAEEDFHRWYARARAFFKASRFTAGEKEWKVAAFLLHQAAEHAYQAILLVFSGYKPSTHNLDKLRRYTCRFSIELALLFPKDTKKEDHLFRLLLQGYIDARYNEDYVIHEEEVALLLDRVEKLLSIATRICRNRLLRLDKMLAA